MADRTTAHKKLKILCLHGWRTSGPILKIQMRDVQISCGQIADFVCVDGCHVASGPPQEIVAQIWPPTDFKYFEWWDQNEGKYTGLDATLRYLAAIEKKSGPFDGVLGFSQGGALAAFLCAQSSVAQTGGIGQDAVFPSLCLGILCSGFIPQDPRLYSMLQKCAAESKASTAVDMWITAGKKDLPFCMEAVDKLKGHFSSATSIMHGGPHALPARCRGGELAIRSLKRFILEHHTTS